MKVSKRPDAGVVCGIFLAAAGLYLGLRHEGLHWYDVARATGALVVFGGTAGASLISVPFAQAKDAVKTLPSLLRERAQDERAVIQQLLLFARAVRQRGAAVLDSEVKSMHDGFLKRAVGLVVDAVPGEVIREILDADLEGRRIDAQIRAGFFENAAGYAPTLGLAGAALGLIHVLRNVDSIEVVGTGVAEGFVSILYGVLLANLVLIPIATKIRARAEAEARACRLITIGVLAMDAGLNPFLIRTELESYAQSTGEQKKTKDGRRVAA